MSNGGDTPDFAQGPLAGVRVLDLSRVIAGPYSTRLLCDLGADVLKIEPPEGDGARGIAPSHDRGQSWMLTFANAGKRSLALDLDRPGAAELVLELAARSELVVENFRPGVADRLGVGFAAVHARNPRAVYASVNGFGAGSRWAERRAYAPIVHAATGLLRDRGYDEVGLAQPRLAHADLITALHVAVALLAALRKAEATGRGEHVEVAMFDAMLATHSEAGNVLLDPPDARAMNPIYDAGSHGAIALAGATAHVWQSLTRAFPDELPDPAPENADRNTKAVRRHRAVCAWLAAQRTLDIALARVGAAGLAAALVVSPEEALRGPLATERELLQRVDDRRGGTRPMVRPPARFSESKNEIRGPAPLLGEHGREILRECLGYDEAHLDALEANGVLLGEIKKTLGG